MRLKGIKLNFVIVELEFGDDELEETLKSFISEMTTITATITPKEQEILRNIMQNDDPELRVINIFPDFERETEAHTTLRKFRDAQFIRPREGGRWKSDKHIEIKQFGKLMWKKIGEDRLFPQTS